MWLEVFADVFLHYVKQSVDSSWKTPALTGVWPGGNMFEQLCFYREKLLEPKWSLSLATDLFL